MPLAGAITVNGVSENEATNLLYKAKYQPLIESMEGAAFHYVCIQQKIPFLQIRSLSNYVGERNKTKWKMQASIQSLNESLVQIVDSIN
jgi:futalosine hydrolase